MVWDGVCLTVLALLEVINSCVVKYIVKSCKIHWVGLRENLNRKPWFLPSNIRLSCKFSHHTILWKIDQHIRNILKHYLSSGQENSGAAVRGIHIPNEKWGSSWSLVGGFNPSEKYESDGMIIPYIMENMEHKSHGWNHQPEAMKLEFPKHMESFGAPNLRHIGFLANQPGCGFFDQL